MIKSYFVIDKFIEFYYVNWNNDVLVCGEWVSSSVFKVVIVLVLFRLVRFVIMVCYLLSLYVNALEIER